MAAALSATRANNLKHKENCREEKDKNRFKRWTHRKLIFWIFFSFPEWPGISKLLHFVGSVEAKRNTRGKKHTIRIFIGCNFILCPQIKL